MWWVKGNFYCTTNQRQNNAWMVKAWTDANWPEMTIESLCGLLGNMEQESTINPGLWQNKTPGRGGYGLVQWTPASKWSNWARQHNYRDDDGDGQMDCIKNKPGEWIPTSAYPVSMQEWAGHAGDIPWSTLCFSKNFERAGNAQDRKRIQYALAWYGYLTGEEPPEVIDPPPESGELPWPNPTPSQVRHKMPLYMYHNIRL